MRARAPGRAVLGALLSWLAAHCGCRGRRCRPRGARSGRVRPPGAGTIVRTVLSVLATKPVSRTPVPASKAARLARAEPLTLANVPPPKTTPGDAAGAVDGGTMATVRAGWPALGFQASVAPAPVVATAPR